MTHFTFTLTETLAVNEPDAACCAWAEHKATCLMPVSRIFTAVKSQRLLSVLYGFLSCF